MKITGIHTFKSVSAESYSEHVLMIQCMSAIEWKKNNGPIHLYTSERDRIFLEALGITGLYDHVNTSVLDEPDEIYWPHFGAACKMKVLNSIQEFPVAFIDNDLIYRDKISVEDESIIYLHDESLFWKNYPPLNFLNPRSDYQFPDLKSLDTANPINVGLFVINDKNLKEEYCKLALDFMSNNDNIPKSVNWAPENLITFWKPLFVEQRLLAAVVENGAYKSKQLFPYAYSGDTLKWKCKTTGKEYLSEELSKICSINWFHLWGEKSSYSKPEGKYLKIKKFYEILSAFEKYGMQYRHIIKNIYNFLLERAEELDKPFEYKL